MKYYQLGLSFLLIILAVVSFSFYNNASAEVTAGCSCDQWSPSSCTGDSLQRRNCTGNCSSLVLSDIVRRCSTTVAPQPSVILPPPRVIVPTITVIQPNLGAPLAEGNPYRIIWKTTGIASDANLIIYLNRYSATSTTLLDKTLIATRPARESEYVWAKVTKPASSKDGDRYLIRIERGGGGASDNSDQYFSIVPVSITPTVTVTQPNSRIALAEGNPYRITWTSTGIPAGTNFSIYLIKAPFTSATDYLYIATTPNSPNGYIWPKVTRPASSQSYNDTYVIQIAPSATPAIPASDRSDLYFSIVPAPPQVSNVSVPSLTSNWDKGTTKTVNWGYVNVPDLPAGLKFRVGLYTDKNGGMWGNSIYVPVSSRGTGNQTASLSALAPVDPNTLYYVRVRLVNPDNTDYRVSGARVEAKGTMTFTVSLPPTYLSRTGWENLPVKTLTLKGSGTEGTYEENGATKSFATKSGDFSGETINCDLGIQGDFDGNQVVNAVDTQMVVNAVLAGAAPSGSNLCFDLNKSGAINAADVQKTVNIALSFQKTTPTRGTNAHSPMWSFPSVQGCLEGECVCVNGQAKRCGNPMALGTGCPATTNPVCAAGPSATKSSRTTSQNWVTNLLSIFNIK